MDVRVLFFLSVLSSGSSLFFTKQSFCIERGNTVLFDIMPARGEMTHNARLRAYVTEICVPRPNTQLLFQPDVEGPCREKHITHELFFLSIFSLLLSPFFIRRRVVARGERAEGERPLRRVALTRKRRRCGPVRRLLLPLFSGGGRRRNRKMGAYYY